MKLNGKRVAVIATTDDMIARFMPPHIKFMASEGAKVDCFCALTGFDCTEIAEIPNVEIHDISFTRFPFTFKNLKGYGRLKEYFKKNHYDLISCMQPVGGVMGRLVGKKFKVKTLYTAHGFHFYKGCPTRNKLIYKNIEKYCAKFTDALVTINEEDFQSAQKFKAKKVYKINGIGVDLSKYKPNDNFDKNGFRSSIGLSEDDFVVTSVGELNENKNTFRLLEVMKNITDKKIKYVVCGTGKLMPQFVDYVKANSLEEQVKVLGFRKDIPEILSITNAYIMPSFREGLSKSMMEAMCYGLPVIASKIRGNTDLLGDEAGGILCDPNNSMAFKDAIIKLAGDAKLCKKYGDRNKKFVKNFDINIVLEQMKQVYEEI